ncbi:MAG: lipid-A-disaccharide synthase [Nitrospirae bacterium]|nr:lipid-A-disaccharide synthase [Nitrospirota bacterium]
MNTVMIVTGESSGELYGSLLAKTLKSKMPNVHIMGVGGERMNKAGVELISGISDAFGIVEVFSAYRKVKAAFKKTVTAIKNLMPDILVLIDYPDFNIKVAEVAKPLGIKILYYVSPQVWAWRKGRVKKIAGLVDRMAVILPFEEGIYRKAGVRCEFVGHPILEEIESELQTPNSELRTIFKVALGLDPDRPLLSLLPGSRPHELKRLLPLMIDVVRQFKNNPEINSGKDYQFCIPLTPDTDEGRYSLYLEALRQEGVVIKKGETVKALAASDMAVVASGTATLQAAFLEVPMVVVYKLSPLTYLFGRLIVDVRHISLVNLLSDREVVSELLQHRANPEDIIKELKKIMFDMHYREEMLNYYRLIKRPFSGMRASERVAEIIMEMTGWKQ